MKLAVVGVLVIWAGAFRLAGAPPETLKDWNSLGAKAYASGNLNEAERLFRNAVSLADSDADRASLSFNLAAVARSQGRYADAERGYGETLAIRQRLSGGKDILLAGPLAGLALTMLAAGDLEKAETTARSAVALGGSQVVPNHALAQVFFAEGRFKEAEQAGLAALEAAAAGSVAQAEVYSTLAAINRQHRRAAEAEAYASKASEILERTVGPWHASTAAAWNNLAQAKLARGKVEEAQVWFEKALFALRQARGDDHPDVGSVAGNLALALAKGRQWRSSEPLFRQAIAIGERSPGTSNIRLAALLESYAAVLRRLENFSEAASIDARATGIRVRQALTEERKR